MDKLLEAHLKKHGIEYKEHRHKAVFTVAESKSIKQRIPGLHCKTLFLKDNAEVFYLVGMPAEKRFDSKRFREHFKIRKIRFGSEKELKEKINLVPGSVSIFGAIYIKDKGVKLIIDGKVWNDDNVGFHPNINTSTLELTHKNLERFYNSLNCEKEIVEL